MNVFLIAARRADYAVYRGAPGETNPMQMGLHHIGSKASCEDFVANNDADEITRQIAAKSDAYWAAVMARSDRRGMI